MLSGAPGKGDVRGCMRGLFSSCSKGRFVGDRAMQDLEVDEEGHAGAHVPIHRGYGMEEEGEEGGVS